METFKPDRVRAGPPDRPQYFSGSVRMQPLHTNQPAGAPEIVADQVLYFVEGEGLVVTEGQRRTVRAGEIAVIPGGVWHWHGATKTSRTVHISIKAAGPTDWEVEKKDWDNY